MSEITRSIMEIARCNSQYKTDMLSPFGLKGCHSSYLEEICATPGISQDQLSQRICINKSNVARQAVILEEDGFIIRKPSLTDKRVMELYPTEKTLQLLPQITAITSGWEQCLTRDMSEEEIRTVTQILERMKCKASGWMEEN